MILARVKQFCFYFFFFFTKKMEEEVREVLTKEEFNIFIEMSQYDKVHSYYLWKKIKNSSLTSEIIYHKLALLHDCGKNQKSFVGRCYTVFFDKKRKKDKHSEIAYEKLEKINIELAILCLEHHKEPQTEEMKLFQQLDDE